VPEPGDTPTIVVMDVDGATGAGVGYVDARKPDLELVDALVRLQLAARRRGAALHLLNVSEELRGLLELVGLAEVLGLEPRREAELGEQLGVEEVVQPGDAPV
jgi:hypothetical protein